MDQITELNVISKPMFISCANNLKQILLLGLKYTRMRSDVKKIQLSTAGNKGNAYLKIK